MITKYIFSLSFLFFLLITSVSSIFAEEANKNNKIDTPQGTAQNNSDQQGTSGVDAGAAAKSVASANIIAIQDTAHKTKNNKPENHEQNVKPTKELTTIDHSSVKEISFADNEQVRVILSNRDINRIVVTGDKIKTIQGPTGLYTAKNDSFDASGSAYISIYGETPFTIFVSTIKGHNLSLLVTPKTAPGRTIILESTTPTLVTNNRAKADGYQKTLIDLMTNMISLEPCEDYEYFSISEAKKHKWITNIKKINFRNVADVTPIAFYRGEKLSGILSKISNRTRNPIILKPSYFYQPGVKAIALSEQTISPLGTCWLYQIVGQN